MVAKQRFASLKYMYRGRRTFEGFLLSRALKASRDEKQPRGVTFRWDSAFSLPIAADQPSGRHGASYKYCELGPWKYEEDVWFSAPDPILGGDAKVWYESAYGTYCDDHSVPIFFQGMVPREAGVAPQEDEQVLGTPMQQSCHAELHQSRNSRKRARR